MWTGLTDITTKNMATKLTKPVSRETAKLINRVPVILTIAPAGSQPETLLGLRLKGKRTQYVCALSDVYRMPALWQGQKLASAKKRARNMGISWRIAKQEFDRNNSILSYVSPNQN